MIAIYISCKYEMYLEAIPILDCIQKLYSNTLMCYSIIVLHLINDKKIKWVKTLEH